MEKFSKQPYEEFPIAVDFSECLQGGDSITAQAVLAVDRDGEEVTADVTRQSTFSNEGEDKVVVTTVFAGDPAKQPYKLTFRCTTANGNRWEMDIQMNVVTL